MNYMRVHTCTHICPYTGTYTHIYTYTCLDTNTHIHNYTCTHTHTHKIPRTRDLNSVNGKHILVGRLRLWLSLGLTRAYPPPPTPHPTAPETQGTHCSSDSGRFCQETQQSPVSQTVSQQVHGFASRHDRAPQMGSNHTPVPPTVLGPRSQSSRWHQARFLLRHMRENLFQASVLASGGLLAKVRVPWLVDGHIMPASAAMFTRCSPCVSVSTFPLSGDTSHFGVGLPPIRVRALL